MTLAPEKRTHLAKSLREARAILASPPVIESSSEKQRAFADETRKKEIARALRMGAKGGTRLDRRKARFVRLLAAASIAKRSTARDILDGSDSSSVAVNVGLKIDRLFA